MKTASYSHQTWFWGVGLCAAFIAVGCLSGPKTTPESSACLDSKSFDAPRDVQRTEHSTTPRSTRAWTPLEWREALAMATSAADRLDRMRGLFHALRRSGDRDEAMRVFDDIVELLEQHHSLDDAQRGAYSDVQGVHRRRDVITAARMYETLIRRYPRGTYFWESLQGLGLCLMEVDQCAEAEDAFQQVIGGSPNTMLAALAWQQLALCQDQGGKQDDALKTLDEMAAHFEGTRHADAARLTRGHLLAKAGDHVAARETYVAVVTEGKDFQIRMSAHREVQRMDAAVTQAQPR